MGSQGTKLLTNFLKDRAETVALNGQCYSWVNIDAGVSQGSILNQFCSKLPPKLHILYFSIML